MEHLGGVSLPTLFVVDFEVKLRPHRFLLYPRIHNLPPFLQRLQVLFPVAVEPFILLFLHNFRIQSRQSFLPTNFDSGGVLAKGLIVEEDLLVVGAVVPAEVVVVLFLPKQLNVDSELVTLPLGLGVKPTPLMGRSRLGANLLNHY